jgi:hypothetical protein
MALEQLKISEILDRIESGEMALPDLQREFVWSNTQVRDFIDSIYKKHPVGMLLVWDAPDGEEIPITGIEGNDSLNRRYRSLIIDGQQRCTSLLLVKKGELKQTRRKRTIKLLFNPLEDRFEISNAVLENKPEWFDVTRLLNGSIMSMVNKERITQECRLPDILIDRQIITKLENLKDQLTRETIPVFKISSNVKYEEIADIFVKINSKGTRIRITELLLALLSIKAPGEFKIEVYDYLNELSDRGWDIDVPILIKSLIGIMAGNVRLSSFRDNKMKKVDEEDLKNAWAKTKEHLDQLITIFKENLGIDSSKFLPSENVLVPLVIYLNQKDGNLTSNETNELILWFLLASYWSRYTGSTESRLDEDIRLLIEHKNLAGPIKNIRDQSGRLLLDEQSFSGKWNDRLLLPYVVARHGGASDWFRGHKITTSDIELHHIFPKSVLIKLQTDSNLIDDISNIAFLTQKANRKVSNSDPEEYLATIDPVKLEKQFIPPNRDLWKQENYEKFLQKRREIMIRSINDYLINVLGLKE